MPRQNRVTPFGEIVASPDRGTLMGNRGCLHDASGRIVRPFRTTNWIYCLLKFKGRRRQVMTPGRYTELFFPDEATALAAGHRPCFECQRERYCLFMDCWAEGNKDLLKGKKLSAPVVDEVLHRERIGKNGEKVKWRARLGELPVGVIVEVGERAAGVVVERGFCEWRPKGYSVLMPAARDLKVEVLTPASAANAIKAGFSPAAMI